jgi:hemolysin activation/secretion protein
VDLQYFIHNTIAYQLAQSFSFMPKSLQVYGGLDYGKIIHNRSNPDNQSSMSGMAFGLKGVEQHYHYDISLERALKRGGLKDEGGMFVIKFGVKL